MNKKGNRKYNLLLVVKFNQFWCFISSFFFCLSLFCMFYRNYLKWRLPFWYYDLSTSPCFIFNINSYTFVVYLCIKIWHIAFLSFSYHLQSWTKHLLTFSHFSTIYLHHKWNRSRSLSPESECRSCMSCRTT